MNIDCQQFWTLLSDSRLVDANKIDSLVDTVESRLRDKGREPDPNAVASALVQNNVITKYQAEILLAGRSGPFRFGDYLVVERIDEGPNEGTFLAKQIQTGHPVTLEFLAGEDDQSIKNWKIIKRHAETSMALNHPNLLAVYDTVTLPEYRVLVSQQVSGSPLSMKLPRKGRLPWADSCGLAAQVANGLAKLHEAGLAHGGVSPDTIMLAKKGPAMLRQSLIAPDNRPLSDVISESQKDYLAPEHSESNQATAESDIYSLGCTLHRMIRGLAPFQEVKAGKKQEAHRTQEPPTLEKYELPKSLESLLGKMLHKSPKKRPQANELAAELAKFSGKPEKIFSARAPKVATESKYRESLVSALPFVAGPSVSQEAPKIVTLDDAPRRPVVDPSIAPKVSASAPVIPKKKSNSSLIIVAASLAGLACLIGLGAWLATQTKFKKPLVVTNDLENEDGDSDPIEDNDPSFQTDPGGRLVQVFVEDDGEELWETPTTGMPVDFSYLPTGVQIALAMRPAQLLDHAEGAKIIQALGPQVDGSIDWLTQTTGLELDEIDQLILGFCSTDQVAYKSSYVIRLATPMKASQLVQLWRPQVASRDEATGIYENGGGLAFFLIPDSENPDMATGFAMGSLEQMQVVSDLAGANPLSSVLKNLAVKTDSSRMFNCLFIPNGLFNDEGQALLRGPLDPMRSYLRVFLPNHIRSALISMHLDEGFYLETYLEHSEEVKATELVEQIDSFLQGSRDAVAMSLAQATPNPHWDQLRSRFVIMANELYQNSRLGIEGKDVLANCWLPEIAAHNLIAGSELALTYSGGNTIAVAPAPKAPASLAELLSKPRDLSVTTNPDLGLLLAGIKSSIEDEFGQLPFKFDIKLVGNDLLKDGITQNQRPGDFEISQKSLAEILTEIMFRANPDKDATGPDDPACKLVWVVAEETSGDGEPIVLITTRDAVAENGYTLPEAFQTQE